MSTGRPGFKTLGSVDFKNLSEDQLKQRFYTILNAGIHGIAFSVYLENQRPGSIIYDEQIQSRMEIIKPFVKWIRSFSCTDGNELIPCIAHEKGLKTMVGAWLGSDPEKNEQEIEGIIKVAKAGDADILAVGNEVLLRGELSEQEIVNYILRVKKEAPGIPVGYVDAYYMFALYPKISEICDIILANCYPFWEGYPFEHALVYLKEMYNQAVKAGKGKKVIITETGWPNHGSLLNGAVPSYENAVKYFINTYSWAAEDEIDVFYFSGFDESWKINSEGDVGAYWGIWDKDEKLKY